MAVAIMCLGSLINFHQYKIWGKPLIPNFVCIKRDAGKDCKVVSFSKVSGSSLQVDGPSAGEAILSELSPLTVATLGTGVLRGNLQAMTTSPSSTHPALRGPPVS